MQNVLCSSHSVNILDCSSTFYYLLDFSELNFVQGCYDNVFGPVKKVMDSFGQKFWLWHTLHIVIQQQQQKSMRIILNQLL